MVSFSIVDGPTHVGGLLYRCNARVEGRQQLLAIDVPFSQQCVAAIPNEVRRCFQESIELFIKMEVA